MCCKICRELLSARTPPILSDNLALVLALCKGRSNTFKLLSVLRRIFVSGFWEGFVLSFRLIPSELSCSNKGSRFFDRDYDSSKSLLHALAQRFARSSPSRTKERSAPLARGDVQRTDGADHDEQRLSLDREQRQYHSQKSQ